jgi:hypothetical protein
MRANPKPKYDRETEQARWAAAARDRGVTVLALTAWYCRVMVWELDDTITDETLH